MAIRNVVTRGFGPGATIAFVTTRGFGTSGIIPPEPDEEIVQRGSGRSRRQRREEEWRRERERVEARRAKAPGKRTALPVEQTPRGDDRESPAPVVQIEAFAPYQPTELAAALTLPDELAAKRREDDDALLLLLADA